MNRFVLFDGMKIAYQEWGSQMSTRKILALHGWLDNSNSFCYLGPYLAERGYHVVAIDQAGHGRSSHLPPSGYYSQQKGVFYAKQILDIMDWKKSSILGHSLGGVIAVELCACFPELVNSLVVIDSLGAFSATPEKTVEKLRKAILEETKHFGKSKSTRLYPSYLDAVNTRVRNSVAFSKRPLSFEAAKSLVSRGVVLTESSECDDVGDIDTSSKSAVRFCHDPRLQLPNFVYHTPEQGNNYFEELQTPTLLITADPPVPEFQTETTQLRLDILQKKGLVHYPLAGSHHLHADPDTAPIVAEKVYEFLTKLISTKADSLS